MSERVTAADLKNRIGTAYPRSVYMAEHYRRALVNIAEWGDGASMESARAYARAVIRAAKGDKR